MLAVAKREFKQLYTTMTAEIFSAVLIALVGVYFIVYNMTMGYPYFSYTLTSAMFILMITVPLLTMRSFSEERRTKTDQILLTSPLRLSDIVLGKFFAMCAVMLLTLAVFCICPLIIGSFGTSYPVTDYSSLLAFFVIGCFYISIGMLISSMTESTVIAAICTIGALVVVYLWQGLMNLMPSSASGAVLVFVLIITIACIVLYNSTKNWIVAGFAWIAATAAVVVLFFVKQELLAGFFTTYLAGSSVTEIMTNFSQNNLFDLGGLLKLLILTGVMLFLTAQTIQKRRWN